MTAGIQERRPRCLEKDDICDSRKFVSKHRIR